VLLIGAGYITLALTQPLLSIPAQTTYAATNKPAKAVELAWPDYGQAAIGATGYGVLATHGEQKPLSTASIAKVMTALAVLRQRPLQVGEQGPEITITQADVDSYRNFVANDGSVVGVALGERITEYQALQALLLPSANNMADTLARWAFGSTDAYVKYANQYAKHLGLNSVRIADASGYDVKTVASARDLTLLGTVAMLNPVFAEIVAQPSAKIPVQGTITNYNYELGESGNVGIKTGNNDGNKGAFLFATKQVIEGQELMVVGTIMGGPDLLTALNDSEPLAQSAANGFSLSTFATKGQKVGSYTIPGQGTVDATASADLKFLTWGGSTFSSSATLRTIDEAEASGAQVGTLTARNTQANTSSSVPVTLSTATKEPSVLWRLTHPLGN
jgi:D-alanyl-D-alanine carboxypeptidase (penicillin-binding protein 5/6)